jgi:hypothetical protein
MQTRKNNPQVPDIDEERDIELENIIGNLMIAQYQVDKLRSSFSCFMVLLRLADS